MSASLRAITSIELEDLIPSSSGRRITHTGLPSVQSPYYRLDEINHVFNHVECTSLCKNLYQVKLSYMFGSNPKKVIPALGAITTTLELKTRVIAEWEQVVKYGGAKTENTLPTWQERTYTPAPASVTPSTNMAIVIDLETMSLSVDSKIIEIGAVFGDLNTGEIYGTFYTPISPHKGLNEKRTTSVSTLQWHLDTRTTQLGLIPLPDLEQYVYGKLLDDALGELEEWIDACQKSYVSSKLVKSAAHEIRYYSKGPEFDIAKLVHAYEQLGNKSPFNYRAVASIRNFEHLYASVICSKADNVNEAFKSGMKEFQNTESVCPHDALYDSVAEFHFAHLVMKQLLTR